MVLTVKSVNAQKPPKPSVPQFSLKLVVNNESLGCQKRVEVAIKNQLFMPSPNEDTFKDLGYTRYSAPDQTSLYYQVQAKGFDGDWIGFTFERKQSDSMETIVSNGITYTGYTIDFRVRAAEGYFRTYSYGEGFPVGGEFIITSEGDWSSTQTININNETTMSSPSQTTPPTNPTTTSGNNQPQTSEQTQQSKQNPLPNFLLGVLVGLVFTVVVLLFGRWRLTRLQKTS
jgi:hypothetical protein